MRINIHNEGEPELIERWFRGDIYDHLFWFKVDNEGLCQVDFLFPKSVPSEIKQMREEILEECKRLLL